MTCHDDDEEFQKHLEEEPDPQLDPAKSPGIGSDIEALEDIEVSREDVTIGEATPAELAAADTEPVAGDGATSLLADLDADDSVDRRRAALALKDEATTDAVVTGLAQAATRDDDADVRQFAVEALTAHGGERAAAVAVALLDDPDPWVRAEAVVALDNVDRAAHEDEIAAAVDDDHHAVRRNAAISLFKLRGEAMENRLLSLSRDDSERVREWAAHMLGGVDSDAARDRLRDLTDDPATVVRQTAERALEAEPDRFRRQFGALENDARLLPGEDRLNRMPDL
ncbi:HEAT repeat domain-containing protein [Haloplanus aerogenes]|uniref:HEAT repeat protein n=1 Tax=Haloplanus aerogenes TaxID=660522 RepID=A0A3M0DU89_9EURY|nr:HEAT repeat domain-containing protein [Haloplanus aerogenes]AZH25809.1 protein phosphatase [Haloplanus aerogenes]RMB25549.1 HEAT repeat protein [Haloplanus aerogenes]